MRDGAFSKFLDTFLLGNVPRGKTYAMSSWRSYVHDRARCDVEEARKKVLADRKKATADLEAEIAAQKKFIKKNDNEIRRLHQDAAEQDPEFQDKLKQMKIDLQVRQICPTQLTQSPSQNPVCGSLVRGTMTVDYTSFNHYLPHTDCFTHTRG